MRLLTLLTCLIGAPATAACIDTNPNPTQIMPGVHEAMLTGDYDTFVARADAAGRVPETQKLNIINVLKRAHPKGFQFCEVLIRRDLSDKVFQEISVFSEPGKDWVFLYVLGMRIGGVETLANFKFSNTASEEIAKLR